MTDNKIDVNIIPMSNGSKKIIVTYYHYSRKDKDRITSQTDYVWQTFNEEMFRYFESKRTKVFYGQIRAMCRFYGVKYKRMWNVKDTKR